MQVTIATTGAKIEEGLRVMQNHEWAWKERLTHVMCPSCGAQHTAKRWSASSPDKPLPHRKGCAWKELYTLLCGAIGRGVK